MTIQRSARLIFAIGVSLGIGLASHATAQTIDTTPSLSRSRIVEGDRLYQSGDPNRAIAIWETVLKNIDQTESPTVKATVQAKLARAFLQIGQPSQALQRWRQVTPLYRNVGNQQKVGQALTEQAQIHSLLGQYQPAINLLCGSQAPLSNCQAGTAISIAQTHNNIHGEIAATGSLGNAYWQQGDHDLAIQILEQALRLNRQTSPSPYDSSILNGLGNAYAARATLRYQQAQSLELTEGTPETPSPGAQQLNAQAQADDQAALRQFESSFQSAQLKGDRPAQLKIWLNSIPIYHRTNAQTQAHHAHTQATQLLHSLPLSQTKARAAIDLATLLDPVPQGTSSYTHCLHPQFTPQAQALLNQAATIAQQIGDRRSESFALGYLGHLKECQGDYAEALNITHQAQWAAETLNLRDSKYLWDWQAARILQQMPGQEEAASQAYQRAIYQLDSLRQDIVTGSRDRQLDFRTSVEPIYRASMNYSLKKSQTSTSYATILQTLDSLKLAELQNYFGNDCVITSLPEQQLNLSKVDPQAAIIHTVVLGDRTAVILTLPNQTQHLQWIEADTNTLRHAIQDYRFQLERRFDPLYNLERSQQLYRWLLNPFETELTKQNINTLVFVQDSLFRGIPMAALHDGEQYLIETYAISNAVSLQLLDPKPINPRTLKALAFGLTENASIQGEQFPQLPYVQAELLAVQAQVPDSKMLLNEQWTTARFQDIVKSTDVNTIHMATHARFGSVPEDTFLVIGNNQKLNLTEFEALLRDSTQSRDPIELLILTACQTAYGDDRSALGLAGVALQTGTKSVMASLWAIADASTAELVEQFYIALNQPNTSKAEALRTAQLSLIQGDQQFTHPAYWAPYILIGNWL